VAHLERWAKHYPMRLLFFALLFVYVSTASGETTADSHIQANVPGTMVFRAYLKRDVGEYLSKRAEKEVVVDYELLREAPTQTGVAYPKFYAWVRGSDNDKRIIFEGAMRLAAIERKRFQVTDFVTVQDMVANPKKIEEIFPVLLIPTIREKAGIK
jgi:hypothetical protein